MASRRPSPPARAEWARDVYSTLWTPWELLAGPCPSMVSAVPEPEERAAAEVGMRIGAPTPAAHGETARLHSQSEAEATCSLVQGPPLWSPCEADVVPTWPTSVCLALCPHWSPSPCPRYGSAACPNKSAPLGQVQDCHMSSRFWPGHILSCFLLRDLSLSLRVS